MERFLLYLDSLDDWFFAALMFGERLRRGTRRLGICLVVLGAQFLAVALTLQSPTLGAATAALLTVAALYRSATMPIAATPQAI